MMLCMRHQTGTVKCIQCCYDALYMPPGRNSEMYSVLLWCCVCVTRQGQWNVFSIVMILSMCHQTGTVKCIQCCYDAVCLQEAEKNHQEEMERTEKEKQELTEKLEDMIQQESTLSAKVSSFCLVPAWKFRAAFGSCISALLYLFLFRSTTRFAYLTDLCCWWAHSVSSLIWIKLWTAQLW